MASTDDLIKDVFHVFGLLGGSVGVELLGWKHCRISSWEDPNRSSTVAQLLRRSSLSKGGSENGSDEKSYRRDY